MAYADLVEQETTTAGTGAYTVSGAAPTGRRTFVDAFPENTQAIPYFVTDDAGNFEGVIGNWDAGAGTLTRTIVLGSSNSGAAVNWAAGTKRIYVSAHAGVMAMAGIRHNLEADAEPTSGDNFSDGYRTGSFWIYGPDAWICIGNGGWFKLTTAIDGDNNQYIELLKANSNRGLLLDSRGGVQLELQDPESTYSGNDVAGLVGIFREAGGKLVFDTVWDTTTTDATPKRMEFWRGGSTWDAAIYVSLSGVMTFEAEVVAFDSADPKVAKAWKVVVGATNDASGSLVLGTPTITELVAHASAAAWDIDVDDVTDGSTGNGAGVTLNVTGAASKTIYWSAQVRGQVFVY